MNEWIFLHYKFSCLCYVAWRRGAPWGILCHLYYDSTLLLICHHWDLVPWAVRWTWKFGSGKYSVIKVQWKNSYEFFEVCFSVLALFVDNATYSNAKPTFKIKELQKKKKKIIYLKPEADIILGYDWKHRTSHRCSMSKRDIFFQSFSQGPHAEIKKTGNNNNSFKKI